MKTVLVAAASQGLGKAIAEAFVANGDNVHIFSRHTEPPCDLTDLQQIEQLLKKIGPVDVLVTNAGGPKPGQFNDISDADWQQAFELTFLSAVRLIRGVLPNMQKNHWGRIICLTSTSVKQPIPHLITSNALRAAVANLAKSLANEVGKDGVTVNVVAPGMFETDRLNQLYPTQPDRDRVKTIIPTQRFGDVTELAATVVFLASDQASYINGVLLPVDGGLTKTC
ncbi:MAG: hypothetical protein ACD_41C00179G0003 [uncultured bacterium]|nr:MAG: hypothetical protein ACD_41C00179G0003 [uncultured bacterium]HBY73274.1 hypothetical protein [Candidatus Kerfeldbacteria bacterium]